MLTTMTICASDTTWRVFDVLVSVPDGVRRVFCVFNDVVDRVTDDEIAYSTTVDKIVNDATGAVGVIENALHRVDFFLRPFSFLQFEEKCSEVSKAIVHCMGDCRVEIVFPTRVRSGFGIFHDQLPSFL